MAVRAEFARKVGFTDRSHDADAPCLEDLVVVRDGELALRRLHKTLMVHN